METPKNKLQCHNCCCTSPHTHTRNCYCQRLMLHFGVTVYCGMLHYCIRCSKPPKKIKTRKKYLKLAAQKKEEFNEQKANKQQIQIIYFGSVHFPSIQPTTNANPLGRHSAFSLTFAFICNTVAAAVAAAVECVYF